MKTISFFISLILFVVCYKAEAKSDTVLTSIGDTLIVIGLNSANSLDSIQQQPTCLQDNYNKTDKANLHSDDISALTLAVNTVNNGFTVVTIVVGIVTLIVAIAGLFGYRSIIKKVDKTIYEAKNLKKRNEKIEKTQTLNNQYMQSINRWILDNANDIAEAKGPDSISGKELKNKSMINYYLMKLYLSSDETNIEQCINYIKNQGDANVIKDLQFIVDNDPDKKKSNKASEAIGFIRGKS